MTRVIRSKPWLVLTLAPVVAACDQSTPKDPSIDVTVRDSAGIEIVENRAPQWGPEDFWTLDPEPEFVIGGYRGLYGATNDSSHLIWRIRGVAPLSDGRLAMVSAGERTGLLFERSGAFSNTIGRPGRGPGEFFGPEHLQVLPGDTIVVWDAFFGGVSHFDPSGRLLKERSIDLGAVIAATATTGRRPPETVRKPLPDGSFLVEVRSADWQRPSDGSVYREPVEYVRIDSAYSAQSFGWWDGRERMALDDPRAPSGLPFAVGSAVAAGGNPLSVYVTNGDSYEVHQFSPKGLLVRIIRRAADEPVPISASELEDWRETISELNPWATWPSWDRAVAALPPRRHPPPIRGIRVDTEGCLWVLDGPMQWSIFGPEGRWLGSLRLPVGLSWIGKDLVIGMRPGSELGIDTFVGHRLVRRGE